MNSLSGVARCGRRQAFVLLRADAPDDAPDRLAVEVVADADPSAAGRPRIDVAAGAAVVLFSDPSGMRIDAHAALHVGDADRRAPGNPRGPDPRARRPRIARRSCRRRSGTASRPARRSRRSWNHILPSLSCVTPHSPPRSPPVGLLDDAVRRPSRAERVVRAVHPVVQRPGQERFLVLDVADAGRSRCRTTPSCRRRRRRWCPCTSRLPARSIPWSGSRSVRTA